MDETPSNHIDAAEFQRITNVSRETFYLYEAWYNLLTHWNKTINLVSPSTIHNYWLRHALDSWQVFENLTKLSLNKPHPFNILDLGSGAGFPGLAAAIHYRDNPNAHMYLIEANGKKCNFLRAVIRELGLPATAIQARAENVPEILRDKHFNIISARAFAPLPKLLQYSAPYWSVDKQEASTTNTIGIFPKGRNWQEEVTAARKYWSFDLETTTSQTDEDAMILLVTNLKNVDNNTTSGGAL